MTATPKFRPALTDAEVWPRPLQTSIRVWHGSATSRESVDLAARYGDPLFSANVTNPIEPYAELIRYYRERWAAYGHDPADAVVGAGTALELFQSDIAPVLRRDIPDPPWGANLPVASSPAVPVTV